MKKDLVISLLVSIIITLSYSSCTESAKLNKPRVLLPLYSQYPNNFTLQVDNGGCYKWTTKSPAIVRLTGLDTVQSQGCSSRAVVTAVTNEDARHTAIIFAEDIRSGEVLRCDVIIDSIASLSIVTTTREIFVEEAPEVFEVQAYDVFGNQFTTLDGFVFEWSLSAVTRKGLSKPSLTHKVIKVMKFEESHYKVPSSSLAEIENAGLHGNKVLLFGMSTGQAKVSAALLQPQYKDVQPAPAVILAVIANLVLDPQDALLMPKTRVSYSLELVRQGRLERQQLPSEQYQLEVEDGDIAMLEYDNVVQAKAEGRTRVLLRDSNAVDLDEEGRAISATLRVGQPASLELEMLPPRSWYAVVGRDYNLHVRVFDANKHAFHLGEGVHIYIEIPPSHFKPHMVFISELRGRALKVGSVPVDANLRGTKLAIQRTMIINSQVEVIPSESYIPWLQQSANFEFPLNAMAETGDGSPAKFVWHSKNPDVVLVMSDSSKRGLVGTVIPSLNGVQPGAVANVSVSLDTDPLNSATSTIYFLPPCKLSIPNQSVLQAEVGTDLHIPVAIYVCKGKQKFLARRCEHLNFDVFTDSDLYYNSTFQEEQTESSCTAVIVSSDKPTSLVKVTVKLNVIREDGTILTLEDVASVSFFKPLRVIYPASGETVLAPDTSRNIIFEGGPRALPGQKSLKRHISMIDGNKIAQAWDLDRNSASVVLLRVQCNDIGTTELLLLMSPANDPMIKARGSVKVYCAIPDKLVLTPNLPEPDYQYCSTSAGSYVTLASREFEVVANVYDQKGRKFDNISSIAVHWSAQPDTLIHKMADDMLVEVIREESYGLLMPGRIFHLIKPWGTSGSLVIKASLKVLNLDEVSGETKVDLVEPLLINPSRLSVYNHTSKVARFKITRGSMSYILNILEGEGVADVHIVRSRKIIEVTPLKPGRLRFSLIDACLPEELKEAVFGEVVVLGVGSVRVVVASQVQLGNTIEATLVLLDTDTQELTPPAVLPITHRADHNIIELKQLTMPLKFSVTGVSLGDSELKFSVDDAESQPTSIHVFPPIKLWPRDIALVPGAVLQASTQGGPKVPDATLIFSAATHEKPSATHVSESGLVTALAVGSSSLTVKAMAPDESLYSEDSTTLRVVALTGIEIWVPTRKLEQGTRMPAYVQGKSSNDVEIISPFVMATLKHKYSWTERGGGLLVHSQESLAHVEAINVGVAELVVEVLLDDGTRLAHSVFIEIIPALRFYLPVKMSSTSPILIAPRSKIQFSATSGRFLITCGGEGIITVSDNGLVTSLGPLGDATIMVRDTKTNQELVAGIKVVPIHYIMATAVAPVDSGIYPRGMKAQMSLTYHDSIGREILMPSSERNLNWISSRPQTMSLKRDKLQLGEPGKAVLDVWDMTHHAYLLLTVTQVISPLTLAVGDHVCFSLGQPGEWSSQPKSVMRVDAQSGWVVALQAGEANIKFVTDEGSSTWAEVQVQPVSKVQLLPMDQSLAINVNQPLVVNFFLKASGEQNKRNNLIDSSCVPPPPAYEDTLPVDCKVSWEDSSWDSSLHAFASFNFNTGLYSCNITTRLSEATSKKLSLFVCLKGQELCSEKLSVPFYKSITVEPKEVIVGKNGGKILISGTASVLTRVKIETPPGLEVGPMTEVSRETVMYPVSLTPVFWTLQLPQKYGTLLITVTSPLTGQQLVLPVVVEDNLEAPSCPRPLSSTSWWAWLREYRGETIGVISAIVIIAASLHVFWTSYKFRAVNYNPEDNRAADNNGSSPFTPRSNSSFQPGNGSLNTSGLVNTSPGPRMSNLPYASTSRIYGSQHDLSWGSPQRPS